MASDGINILLVDDEASIRWVIEKTLAGSGHKFYGAEDAEQGAGLIKAKKIDFAMVDINLPGQDGLTFLKTQREKRPELLLAIITGQGSMDNAVTAMKLGAFDYLTKPFDIEEIESLVMRAAQAIKASRQETTVYLPASNKTKKADLIIGNSRSVREVYKSIGRVADTDLSVLIQGESGTGKELIARAIHHHSERSQLTFAAVNCAAIPRELLESELFGYEKGAFTGAGERKIGKLEDAGAGTVLLDEIGDMPLDLQAKLLRVLQERDFQRVGGLNTIRLKARIITSTNQSLLESIEAGTFRGDLYYRISAFIIEASPLRERREDIPLLVAHFLREGALKIGGGVKAASEEALEALSAYDWPGNIRELENVVKSLMIMARTHQISLPDLPRNILGSGESLDLGEKFEQSVLTQWGKTIREACEKGTAGLLSGINNHLERPLIKQVLQLTRWNQVKAAQVLGINRNTLRTKMKALGINKPLSFTDKGAQ